MKIKKDKSYSLYLPKISFNKKNWEVAFRLDEGAESLKEYGHNITHKIYGWSYGIIPYPNDKNRNSLAPHHNDSIRVGFSVGEDGMTLYAYFYNQGEMYREVLATGLDVTGLYHVSFSRNSSGGRVTHRLSQSIGYDWHLLNCATSVFNYPFNLINFSLNFAIGSGKTAPKDMKCKIIMTK